MVFYHTIGSGDGRSIYTTFGFPKWARIIRILALLKGGADANGTGEEYEDGESDIGTILRISM